MSECVCECARERVHACVRAIECRARGTISLPLPIHRPPPGGYLGGDPTDPTFQELIVRWFQFGAFCPLFRLHGKRTGGPPADACGDTFADNEVWTLAPAPDHYAAMVSVMRARESLRNYTAEINAVAAATGLPMVRPMFLAFPDDPECGLPSSEDQFMFGPSWLVAPVYEQGASNRSVYLPLLPAGHGWTYYFSGAGLGAGGARVTLATPIGEFPLLFVDPPLPGP